MADNNIQLNLTAQDHMTPILSNIAAALKRLESAGEENLAWVTQLSASLGSQQQAAQATTQSTNQLAAAYLAQAQAIREQTQGYTQAQAATLAYKQQQDQLREATRQAAQEAQEHASTFAAAWTKAAGVLSALGIAATLAGIARAVKDFATDSVSGFAEFERGMLKIASLMPGVTKQSAEFAQFGQAIHDLAISTGIDTKNIQAAFFDVQSTLGSGKTKEAFEILRVGAELAVVGFTDVKTATVALTAVLNQFSIGASEAGTVANALNVASLQNRVDFEKFARTLPQLLPLLTTWKVSLESAGAVLAVTTGRGLEATKSITGMSEALLAIGAPTVRAKKYMEELAHQLGLAKIEIKTFADGSADLFSTFKQFEGLQPDLMRRVFGGNKEALLFMLGITNNMEELRAKILEATNAQNDMAKQSALAHSGILQQWRESVQAVSAFYDAVGAVVGQHPDVIHMVENIKAGFLSLTASLNANKTELTTLMTVFARLGEVGIGVIEGLSHAAIYLAGTVGAAVQKVMDGIHSVVGAYNWLKQNIPFVGSGSLSGGMKFEGGEGMAVRPGAGTAPVDEYKAYEEELKRRGISPEAHPGGATIPRGAPRTGLGLTDVEEGIAEAKADQKASNAAARAAARDALRAAAEEARRQKQTEKMLEDARIAAEREEAILAGVGDAAQQQRARDEAEVATLRQTIAEKGLGQAVADQAEAYLRRQQAARASMKDAEEALRDLKKERQERIKDLDIFGLNVAPEVEKQRQFTRKIQDAIDAAKAPVTDRPEVKLRSQADREGIVLDADQEARLQELTAIRQAQAQERRMEQMAQNLARNIQQTFDDMWQSIFSGGVKSFQSFAVVLLQGIQRMFAQLTNQIMNQLLNALTNTTDEKGGWAGALAQSIVKIGAGLLSSGTEDPSGSDIPGMTNDPATISDLQSQIGALGARAAGGGVFRGLGMIRALAGGGIIDRPSFALLGEQSPMMKEAVVPMPNGAVPVQFTGPQQSSQPMIIEIHNDYTGAVSPSSLKTGKREIIQHVINDIRHDGSLRSVIQQSVR